MVEWVGGFDMYGTARERVFEADEEGDAAFSLGWGGEEGDLVVAGADVELGADACGYG
jgi:hypothetical protein